MNLLRRPVALLSTIGVEPTDTADQRMAKLLLVGVSVMVWPAGVVWGALYWFFGEPIPALLPWAYSVASVAAVAAFAMSRSYRLLMLTQLSLILVTPFLLSLALGGADSSSGVILWSFLAPLGAIALDSPRRAWWWLAAFLVLVVVSLPLAPIVRPSPVNLPSGMILGFTALNIGAVGLFCFAMLASFAVQREHARRRVEDLVLNILPQPIAERLQANVQTIADQFDAASVLFADVVDFTPMSAALSPDRLVDLLDRLFTDFDALVDRYDLEKIKTIGDAYMVAAGVPDARPDHAHVLARMALDMRACAALHRRADGRAIQLRIGISSGPVVAGVIGRRRFLYDLWGDAVNTASRMESHGEPGEIQITRATYELVSDTFECRPRGTVEVKGKGPTETWFLVGERSVERPAVPDSVSPAPAGT